MMNHFTDDFGFKGIRATNPWQFRASKPAGSHPFGAYFTTLPTGTPNLAIRLRIPRGKLEYLFSFHDAYDLLPLKGDRGRWIFYSPVDYHVKDERHIYSGRSDQA